MKWPLHPIAPSTEVLVNALPVNSPIAGNARPEVVASGLSGHAAGVPAAQPARPHDAGYDVACTSGERVAQVR
jgi:hypothetical protein